MAFTSALSIPTGLSMDVEANGHTVVFDGGGAVQLFRVTGGQLTIGGISLINGAVRGGVGRAGGFGGTGTNGTAGATGGNGANGSTPGASGGPAQPGGSGAAATGGASGSNGGKGKPARGGALYIAAGTVTLRNDTFTNDVVAGGSGGVGGAGGSGGSGGGGGNGGTGGSGHGGRPVRMVVAGVLEATAATAGWLRPVAAEALVVLGARRRAARSGTREH